MPKKSTAKKKPATKRRDPKTNPNIKEVVRAFMAHGLKVDFTLEPHQPERFPNDPPAVAVLLDEVERKNKLAAGWSGKNPRITDTLHLSAQSLYLAATWLRVKLNGQLLRSQDDESLNKFIGGEAASILDANLMRNPQLLKQIAASKSLAQQYLCGFLVQFLARNPGLIPNAKAPSTHREPHPAQGDA